MGKRGFQPAPIALKIARGNPAKEKLPTDNPKPAVTIPPPLSWVKGAALEQYYQLGERFLRIGIMTENDGEALSAYCELSRVFGELAAVLQAEPLMVARGESQAVHPAVASMKAIRESMLRLESHFGMTPSSRSSLHVDPKKQDDDLLAFANDNRGRKGKTG